MRIYILPYTHKTYFDANKFHSGIDVSMLTQFHALQKLGHEVRMFCAFGNLQNYYSNVDYISDVMPKYDKVSRKFYQNVQKQMLEAISHFSPDLILSNYGLNKIAYENLEKLNVPVIHYSHAMPGSWSDINFGNYLHEFAKRNTICCVSKTHYEGMVEYYRSNKTKWYFDEIIPDSILFSQYANSNVTVQEHDDTVRHVSALNKEKATFYLFDALSGSNYNFEIYTSANYKGFSEKQQDYYDRFAKKYDNLNDHVYFNVEHSKIMDSYGKSVCNFVGCANDTFTITSLESLMRGVPLIVDLNKNFYHPAFEMLPSDISDKYIKGIKKGRTRPEEFQRIVNSFRDMTLDDRRKLSRQALSVLGKENYLKSMESLVSDAVNKYNRTEKVTGLEGFI